MRQQIFEDALKRIVFETNPNSIAASEQHPNGVRPLDEREQIAALKGALKVIRRVAEEALRRD